MSVWRDDSGAPLPQSLPIPWVLWPLCAVGVTGPVVLLVWAIKLAVLG